MIFLLITSLHFLLKVTYIRYLHLHFTLGKKVHGCGRNRLNLRTKKLESGFLVFLGGYSALNNDHVTFTYAKSAENFYFELFPLQFC